MSAGTTDSASPCPPSPLLLAPGVSQLPAAHWSSDKHSFKSIPASPLLLQCGAWTRSCTSVADLLEMQILRPRPRQPNQNSGGMPSNLCLGPPGVSDASCSLRSIGLVQPLRFTDEDLSPEGGVSYLSKVSENGIIVRP